MASSGVAGYGILLDLDDTLVLTSAVEVYRRRREWARCYSAFGRTILPPGTREFLQDCRALGTLGIVTSAPRTYAEKLIAYHKLPLPVLIAYHDTTRHKPHPAPILAAAERLGLPLTRCCYIGDSESDAAAATGSGAGAVLVSWNGSASMGACRNWSDVLRAIAQHNTRNSR